MRRWRGCPGGWPASLAGAGSPALELSSRFSQLKLGLPAQTAMDHRCPRSVATGLGLMLPALGARFQRLPPGPLIAERHS